MPDNFEKYESLKENEWDAPSVIRKAKADGLDCVTRIRMIRRVFDLSLVDAKLAIDAAFPSVDWSDADLVKMEELLSADSDNDIGK